MDRRKRAKHSRDSLPVGTIRLRRDSSNGKKVRVIKIRNSGPFSRRWIHYARYLWEQFRGPVPAGMRVIHKDGDMLNDAIGNLVVGTAADVAALWHIQNPDLSEKNYAACAAATAEANRTRGKIRRMLGFLRLWYPVDHARKEIVNTPVRSRSAVYGSGFPVIANKAVDAIALGWPGRSFPEACILSALADGGELGRAEIGARVNELREVYGWPSINPPSIFCNASGLLGRFIRKVDRDRYRLTKEAVRSPVSRFVPVHGSGLEGSDRYRGYKKIDPGEQRLNDAG